MKILITGVGGFIGRELSKSLKKENNYVVGLSRSKFFDDILLDELIIEELTPKIDLSKYLLNIDLIIHLAGRVHITSKPKTKDMNEFIEENLLVTQNLLKQALKNNVKNFLFLSSVGVYGTNSVKPFTEEDKTQPNTPYSKSKLLCENYIKEFCKDTKLSYTIIRSPLVYGKNAPGNLGILKKFIDYKIPLPILCLNKNKRSIISLETLINFIKHCIKTEKSINNTFLISDGKDLSTLEIINLICDLNKNHIKTFWCPKFILVLFFKLIKREDLQEKLIKSFQINIDKSISALDWNSKM